MEVSRSLANIDLIWSQYERETGETKFDLNKLIEWLGDRKSITIS